MLLCAGSAAADTVIPYTLNGSWANQIFPDGCGTLSDNPSGGVKVSIDVPAGVDDGGLLHSKQGLTGYSLENDGFIQLEYSSLSSNISGAQTTLDILVDIQFNNVDDSESSMAIRLRQKNGLLSFKTWFSGESNEVSAPDGLLFSSGALGFYSDGSQAFPYFKDSEGKVLYPFADWSWDISGITGSSNYIIDNDFDADTNDGGSVLASANFDQVVYGGGSPASIPPAALDDSDTDDSDTNNTDDTDTTEKSDAENDETTPASGGGGGGGCFMTTASAGSAIPSMIPMITAAFISFFRKVRQ